MADNKIKFLRGTSNEYTAAKKDSDTIYFTTDDGKLYIGDKEVSGNGSITIDDKISDTSTNPVQNKVINSALNEKANKSKYGDTTINVGRKADTTVGNNSTAEGSRTTASGTGSHAEGANTTASGDASHAGGLGSESIGYVSFAHGHHTLTNNDYEIAFGRHNISNSDTLFSIGDSPNVKERHNAFEITTSGGKLHDKDIATMDDIPTSLPASDVKAWAKADTKPTYTASEVGADVSGSANTALTNAKSYTDTKIADLINGAPSTLDTLGEIAKAMENNQSVVEALDTAIGTKANESNLTAHTGDKSNPHSVTKSQVGLGNVPNVVTNDQTPSYTEATSLTKLSSGEKLSVAFGKISKAITDLISHIADSVKHITSTERTNWNAAKTHADSAHAPSNAQANVIETVKVNGTALTPSSKAVDITVPSVGNGTITIKQAGTTKGTFTTNQSGNTTIELTDNNATYSAGTGLSLSGTTFNHKNSITAGTAQGDASKTLTFGGTFTIPTVTYDAQGHITGKGTTKMTMPANPNTDTKVTNTLATTTKAYVTGTTSATTNTGTQVFDTGVYLDTTAGMLTATTFKGALSGNASTSNKLKSTSYITISITTSDWLTNSSGGYVCTKTLSSAMAYTNFNFDVVLSTDQSAAKLQIEAWNNIIADGEITQTTSSGSTTAFTFYAFTNKPSVALTVGIQGVS